MILCQSQKWIIGKGCNKIPKGRFREFKGKKVLEPLSKEDNALEIHCLNHQRWFDI